MWRTCLLLVAMVACEKSAPEVAPSSGQLSKVETELMGYLPGSSSVMMGGNFTKLQGLLKGEALRGVLAEQSSSLVKWTDCFGSLPNMTIIGSIDVAKANQMRLVVSGIALTDLERCANSAGFEAKWDPDRKFLALGGDGVKLGYFELPNKAIYQSGAAASRAAIEAELAATAKDNAAAHKELVAIVERADRAKSIWFAGTVREIQLFGTADLQKGLAVDMTAEVPTESMASEISDGIDQIKDMPMLGGLGKKVTVKRSGKTLRITVDLDGDELATAMRLMKR